MEVSLQIERLTDLRRRIVETVELREAYVREHKLDTAFCIPDANWKRDGPNDYVQLYTKLRDCPVDDIQQMRPLTRNFSGYTFPALDEAVALRDPTAHLFTGRLLQIDLWPFRRLPG